MIKRKIRSSIKRMLSSITNVFNHFKLYFLEENISFGKNVTIGKNVIIKTTDDGQIIIGDNVSIEANSYLYAKGGKIFIEKNSFIGFGSQIVSKKSIKIGDNSLFSAYTVIRDANHGMDKDRLINAQAHDVKEIVIKDDVWLGVHSVVLAGCTIEHGVIVGANAVVTKDIEANTLVGGVPAKFIRERI